MKRSVLLIALVLALFAPRGARTQSGVEAYSGLGLKPQEVLTGTVLSSQVLPGSDKQIVCIATYLTGKKNQAEAVNVRLGVFAQTAKGLQPVFKRDFGEERGGVVANGDLQLLDLDLDGVNEIIVSFDTFEDPLIEQRLGEVILHDDSGLNTAWAGTLEYDATKAARSIPRERRDRFIREFDWGRTMRSRGATLFVDKKVIAVAGERLPEPRILQETYRLRGPSDNW